MLSSWPKLMLENLLTLRITMPNIRRSKRRPARIFMVISKMRLTVDPAAMILQRMGTTITQNISMTE